MKLNELFKILALLVVAGIVLAFNVALWVRDTFMEQEWPAVLAIFLILMVSFFWFVDNTRKSEEEEMAERIRDASFLAGFE